MRRNWIYHVVLQMQFMLRQLVLCQLPAVIQSSVGMAKHTGTVTNRMHTKLAGRKRTRGMRCGEPDIDWNRHSRMVVDHDAPTIDELPALSIFTSCIVTWLNCHRYRHLLDLLAWCLLQLAVTLLAFSAVYVSVVRWMVTTTSSRAVVLGLAKYGCFFFLLVRERHQIGCPSTPSCYI